MSTQTIFLTAGSTSKSVDICLIQNATATNPGNALTGLTYNTGGIAAYYRKGATGTLTAITLATQTVGGAYSSGGFVKIDDTNAPGVYRFDIPDTIIASLGEANITFTATNAAPHTIKIICTQIDLYSIASLFTTTMTESYAADGAAFTPAQALYQLWSIAGEKSKSGTSVTCYKLDGVTTAMTITLDSSTTPTTVHRTG